MCQRRKDLLYGLNSDAVSPLICSEAAKLALVQCWCPSVTEVLGTARLGLCLRPSKSNCAGQPYLALSADSGSDAYRGKP